MAIYSQEHTWEDYLKYYISPKRLEIFFIILSLRQVDNMSFHMNLVSQLAALVYQHAAHRNTDKKNQAIWRNLGKSLQDLTILDVIFLQNGSKNFFMILSLGKVDDTSFHINLVSQLAALVCQLDVHKNKDRRKQLIGRNLVIRLYDILLDDIFLKNGSKCFHYTFPA